MERLVPPTEEIGPRKTSLDMYLDESMIDGLRTKTKEVEKLIKLVESLISLFLEDKGNNEFSNLESYLVKIKRLQEILEDIATDISKAFDKLTTKERRIFHKPHLRELNLAIDALNDLKRSIKGDIAGQEQAKKANQLPPWLYRVGHPKS